MRMLDFARSNRLPFTWRDPGHDESATALMAGLDAASLPVVRLPGGTELRGPSTRQVSRLLGVGRELARREEVDLLVVGGGPAGLGAAVYGASEGL
jgi:thioredoxin reductase (NADPH)